MLMSANKKSPKIPKKYFCEKCDLITCNKKDFEKHLQTKKHNANNLVNNVNNKITCNCGKFFLHKSSLSRHIRNCEQSQKSQKIPNFEITAEMMKNSITEETVLKLIEQNNELLKKMS